jgi:hypothetical protein
VGHVFSSKPKWCAGLKPGVIKVRCASCGRAHPEYFGPSDRDEVRAEIEFLRRALSTASAILRARGSPKRLPAPRRRRNSRPRATSQAAAGK